MKCWKRFFAGILVVAAVLSACGAPEESVPPVSDAPEEGTPSQSTASALAAIDNTKWNYNEEDGVYWQVGVQYCETPVDLKYETLGIFVPAAYMSAVDNGDGTYTCAVDASGTMAGYTAADAPIVIPVDTPGYAAMAAPTDYVSSSANYTSAGFIYVNAGCRGREAGAPAGVTDLKAAVRYLRYNEGAVPGSMERIFTFGMSGGGAQSALMGATGDSPLYAPYLESIGAVQNVSDGVAGSMCWCPITNLDYANEAYEWNMGSTRSGLDEETQNLSDGMARAFAAYMNELGLTSPEGDVLTLTESEEGIYQAGSYYEYIKSVVERSLNNFLADTSFPYTASGSGGRGDFGGFGELGDLPELGELGDLPEIGGPNGPGGRGGPGEDREPPDSLPDLGGGYVGEDGGFREDGINRTGSGQTEAGGTYETAQDYINSLNSDVEWVVYDSAANTASITSVAAFAARCKAASKSVGAFDDLSAAQGENILFGYGDGSGAHFDPVMAELLAGTEYEAAYTGDLERTDAQGNTVNIRLDMYNPMYYLMDYYEGYQTANVAQHWRIRTGIAQGDTALCTEVNLALALESYGVDVDFETVWAQGHVTAERTGDSVSNFIAWVNECLQG